MNRLKNILSYVLEGQQRTSRDDYTAPEQSGSSLGGRPTGQGWSMEGQALVDTGRKWIAYLNVHAVSPQNSLSRLNPSMGT